MYMISAAVARIEYFFSGFVFSFLKDFITFADVFRIKGKTSAEVAQLVEHQLPKLRVAGSSPVCRSFLFFFTFQFFYFFIEEHGQDGS